ncbi:MAG: hypothetical protein AAGH46_05545 [Bacteroidota bacterium]
MKSIYALIIGLLFTPMTFAQLDYNESYFQEFEKKVAVMNAFDDSNFVNTFEVPSFEDEVVTVEYEAREAVMSDTPFMRNMQGILAGFGVVESAFSWCIGASYYLMLKRWERMAFYGALSVLYSGLSDDNLSQNIIEFQLQTLMFTALAALSEIRLVYGLSFGYGFGSRKINSFKEDLTRLTIAAVIGLQLLMSPTWSLLIQTSPFAYTNSKFKYEGFEQTENITSFLINKNNLLTLTAVFYLWNNRSRAN